MTHLKYTELPCPNEDCGSSDAYGIDKNDWGHCFSCGANVRPEEALNHITSTGKATNLIVQEEVEKSRDIAPLPEFFRSLPSRGLTEETIRRYSITIPPDHDRSFTNKTPLFDTDNNHVANKTRLPKVEGERKKFFVEGDQSKAGLMGRQAFPSGGRYITVTEGYEDAMAAFQMTGSKYPCVSVHSSSSALKDVKADFEYLNSFETIVFAFDNDEPGMKAAKACASAGFPVGKVKVLTPRHHVDANDYLLAKDAEKWTNEWWRAPTYRPDGLKLGPDMWQEIIDRKESFAVDYPFIGLNKLTYGLRLSELVTVTADTGVGKTSFLKHIEHLLLTHPEVIAHDYGVGFMHLEEPNGDTALGLLSIHNGQPYHLPDVERPEPELRRAFNEVLNNNRVVIWDHFGSNNIDAVLDKVRHMAALGCKYIVLDHLSIVVSDQAGDERKQLDEITTKLKTLTMELELAVIAVIHTNRQGQIRGTAGVEQLSNIVIRLQRDKTDDNEWRRNVTKVSVEKNRFCGYTGPATYLWYNKDTGRLSELDEEEAMVFEGGGFIGDDHF